MPSLLAFSRSRPDSLPEGRETDSQKASTPMIRRTAAALDSAADRPRKFSKSHADARTGAPLSLRPPPPPRDGRQVSFKVSSSSRKL